MRLNSLFLQLLLGAGAFAQHEITFPCNRMPEVCQNMCYHASCRGQGYDLTFDIEPARNAGDKQIEDWRRQNAGCNPRPNRCSKIQDHNCDEYPFGTTRRTDKVMAQRGNACVSKTENNRQGGYVAGYKTNDPCNDNFPCDVLVVPLIDGVNQADIPACFEDCSTNPGDAVAGPNHNTQPGVFRRNLPFNTTKDALSNNKLSAYKLSAGGTVLLDHEGKKGDTVFLGEPKDEAAFEKALQQMGNLQNDSIADMEKAYESLASMMTVQTQTVVGPTGQITPSPSSKPACTLQEEDPDQGINNRGCICNKSTLPLLTVPSATDVSQSCSYTAMPSANPTNPITIATEHYTSNCQACTLVGGIADQATCTSVADCSPTPTTTTKPTFTVFLSNNSIPIGDADNSNSGSDLRTNAYNQLHQLCPDSATECDSTTNAQISNIPTVSDSAENWELLSFTIQDSHYDNTSTRDQMLAAAVSSWQQAASRSCSTTTYHDWVDSAMDCPSDGPVKRAMSAMSKARKRAPLFIDPAPDEGQKNCDYTATLCSGPDHISKFTRTSDHGSLNNANKRPQVLFLRALKLRMTIT